MGVRIGGGKEDCQVCSASGLGMRLGDWIRERSSAHNPPSFFGSHGLWVSLGVYPGVRGCCIVLLAWYVPSAPVLAYCCWRLV